MASGQNNCGTVSEAWACCACATQCFLHLYCQGDSLRWVTQHEPHLRLADTGLSAAGSAANLPTNHYPSGVLLHLGGKKLHHDY